MSDRGRSPSPRNIGDAGMDVDRSPVDDKANAKVVIVTNLTRNVVEPHLRTIFGFYGSIQKIDLPLFGKSGQNRGKAALEYADSPSAHKAQSHMDGGQLDGATLKVELSNLPTSSATQTRRPSSLAILLPFPFSASVPKTRPTIQGLVPWQGLRKTWASWKGYLPTAAVSQPFAFSLTHSSWGWFGSKEKVTKLYTWRVWTYSSFTKVQVKELFCPLQPFKDEVD